MIGFFIFNGVNSRDHGIYIESYPQSCHAPRRGTLYEIAGRNGSEVDEDGTYDNYTQPYNINVREGAARRADLRSSDLAQWLTGEPGFLRLEDSFEPEYFRLARLLALSTLTRLWVGGAALRLNLSASRSGILSAAKSPTTSASMTPSPTPQAAPRSRACVSPGAGRSM